VPTTRRQYRNTLALRKLVQSRMDELDLRDTRAVEAHSRGLISYSVVYAILTGTTKQIRRETLDRLARGLDLDFIEFVMATFDTSVDREEAWVLPQRFSVLPLSWRAHVEFIIGETVELYLRIHGESPPSGSNDSKPGKTG
jgi:hypothetical protein